ncbi:MAG: hypothetical protein K8R90_10990 [Candidatus Cloacimonetes bacterium]|nr:hypothetical protein [Candidatus Cloacimonadota bacterium]
MLCFLLQAAPTLPGGLRRPTVHSRLYTHFQLVPPPDSLSLPVTDSLACALWPLRRVAPSMQAFFARRDDNRFLVWGGDKAVIAVSPIAGAAMEGDEDEQALFLLYGTEVDVAWGSRLSMWGRWWYGFYSGDLPWADKHSPLVTGWHKRDPELLELDDLEAWMVAASDWGDFALGRGRFQVGNGVSGSIILSRAVGNYGWASWELDAGPVSLSLVHASLLPAGRDTLYSEKRLDEKYLMLHRLDIEPTDNLSIFAGETIVYGGRAPDVSYLLPHTFLRIVEHKLHDRDNVAIFAGFEWRSLSWLTLYGQGYLDELRIAEIMGDWWGNKYAVQGGVVFCAPTFAGGVPRLTLEGVAIRPWLYTHNSQLGSYTHEGEGLGYPLGANLIAYTAEANLPLPARLSLDAAVTFVQQGSVGYDPATNYDARPSNAAGWLEGDVTDTLYLKGAITWLPLAHHSVKLAATHTERDSGSQTNWFVSWQTRY